MKMVLLLLVLQTLYLDLLSDILKINNSVLKEIMFLSKIIGCFEHNVAFSPASGTEIIKLWGEHQLKTGDLPMQVTLVE